MAESDAEAIRAHDWRQGSIVPPTMADRLAKEGSVEGIEGNDLLIVVSHDCDIVAQEFEKEPFVEVIVALEIDQSDFDGSCTYGKNPRRLDFTVATQNGARFYSVSVHNRFRLDRHVLANGPPDTEKVLPQALLRVFRVSLGKRYHREAFPDTLNDRLATVVGKLRSVLRKQGRNISALYLGVSDAELPPSENYVALLIGTMEVAAYADADLRVGAQAAIDGCEALMNECNGIEVGEARLVSEGEFTIDALRYLKRWDWDDLSYREDPPDSLPLELT